MDVDVLVTGAGGGLGSAVVWELRRRGYTVFATGRRAESAVDAIWDISFQDHPTQVCSPKVVVHAAAEIGRYQHPLSDSRKLFETNVLGTLRVLNWCLRQAVRSLILISGAIVYGEWGDRPKSETDEVRPWAAGCYAVSKWFSEKLAEQVSGSDMEVTILRLSSLYGVQYGGGLAQRFLQAARLEGRVRLQPPFDDAFDLLHVSDAARAVRLVLERGGAGLWNVGGRLTSVQRLAELCAQLSGVQVEYTVLDKGHKRLVLNWVDDSKARRELGHSNEISLETGLEEIRRNLLGSQPFEGSVSAGAGSNQRSRSQLTENRKHQT